MDLLPRTRWVVLATIVSVSAALAYHYFLQVDLPNVGPRVELHQQILAGTAPSPYCYRVLVPFLVELPIRAISILVPYRWAFLLAYAVYDLAAVTFLLAALYTYLRLWFPGNLALLGVLFAAATMVGAFKDHYYQPWSLLEPGLLSVGLWLCYNRKHLLGAVLVVIASLNRETAVLLPMALLGTRLQLQAGIDAARATTLYRARLPLLFLAIWSVVFVGLRAARGVAAPVYSIGELAVHNTRVINLILTVMNNALFLGCFWVFAVLGLKHAPNFVRGTAVVVPIYLGATLIWGVWHEVRLLMPLYPILIPLALSYITRQETPDVGPLPME